MEMFLITLQQIIILFLLILIGYIAVRAGAIPENAVMVLSSLVMNVACPAIVLVSLQSIDDARDLQQGLLFSLIGQLLMIGLSFVLVRPVKTTVNIGVERGTTSFSNSAFMGIPLLSALYGTTGAMYASIYGIIWATAFWCYGVPMMKRSNSFLDGLKNLLSINTYAILFGILLFALKIRLPGIVMTALGYTASLSTPLSMFCIGITLASMNLGSLLHKRIVYLSVVKNIVIPLIILAVFRAFGMIDLCGRCVLIACACPASVNVSVISKQIQPDDNTGASVFVLTTVMSLLTISVFAGLMG